MIEITEIMKPNFGFGYNNPFLGRDSKGKDWVVKAEPAGCMRHLACDYIGSRIGIWLGLPWVGPVKLGRLAAPARRQFEKHYETSINKESLCVVSGYRRGLGLITYGEKNPLSPWNSNGPFSKYPEEERIRIVRTHLAPLLTPENLSALYGRVVFDNWLAEKDPMMDMLQIDSSSGKFVCLDASTCLNERSRTEAFYESRAHDKAEIHYMEQGLTLYAKAMLSKPQDFEPWLDKVQTFTSSDWDLAASGLPDWSLPDDYQTIKKQTLSTKAFISHFRARVAARLS